MKCREYETYNILCQTCDIKGKISCCKKFDFDKKQKYINIERRDSMGITWNECPTYGNSIGYQPKNKDYRCSKCGQLISWKD